MASLGIWTVCTVSYAAPPMNLTASKSCLGPPYLLASFHGGSKISDMNQVYQYSRDGCLLSSNVLTGGPTLDELRGLLVLPSGSLLVANANKDSSKLIEYGACSSSSLARAYQSTVVGSGGSLVHPYGLAISGSNVFVSNQDTYSVVVYSNGVWSPDLFVQYTSDDDVRGLTVDGSGVLYVAVEETGVLRYNSSTRSKIGTIDCDDCIGMFYDSTTNAVFIGSNGKDEVYQYGVAEGKVVRTFKYTGLSHPAGLVVYGGALFVNAQTAGKILQFDVATGDFVSAIVSSVPDDLEGLTLAVC